MVGYVMAYAACGLAIYGQMLLFAPGQVVANRRVVTSTALTALAVALLTASLYFSPAGGA